MSSYKVMLYSADDHRCTMTVDKEWSAVVETLLGSRLRWPDETVREVARVSWHLNEEDVANQLLFAFNRFCRVFPESTHWSFDLANKMLFSDNGCMMSVRSPDTNNPGFESVQVRVTCAKGSEAHRLLHEAGFNAQCLS